MASTFAYTQSSPHGVNQAVGGIEPVMAYSDQMMVHEFFGGLKLRQSEL
jgi:hypothetical protein